MAIIPGPSILPQYAGGNMGQSLADAFMTKYQLDRQKALDAIQYGIGLQWPGSQASAAPQSSDAPIGVGDRIRAALSHVGIGSNPVPAKQAEWKLAQGGPSVSVTPTTAPVQDAGDGIGGLPDYMTLPNGQRIPTIMTPFGSRILAAMKTRADIALAGTEADKNTADAGLSRRKAGVPMPGDTNYVSTMTPIWSGEAGAKANAELPVKLQEIGAQNQGRIAAARIGAGATLGAAGIGAKSRENVANIEQGGANQRQQQQQSWEQTTGIPLRAGAAQSTEGYKEGGEIIPSVVRPINNGIRSFFGAKPLGVPAPNLGPLPNGASAPVAKPTITSAERAALIAKGHAPADVDAQYQTVGAGTGGGSSF